MADKLGTSFPSFAATGGVGKNLVRALESFRNKVVTRLNAMMPADGSEAATLLTISERGATPSSPTQDIQVHLYVKANKLVLQWDDAGTVRYKYLDLTGTGVTWIHSTSAP